jgi:hypothetical protein
MSWVSTSIEAMAGTTLDRRTDIRGWKSAATAC